tara:strand:+ start:526 stop:1746 length:1221 start_codon:yes stop_codon:yes gene_type:complete
MDLHFKITNQEDIEYLESINEKEQEELLKSAISIGLKSINMAQLSRDGLSYINPIKDMIKEENDINSDNIKCILDILQDTLKNSTRKGRFGESMAITSLIKKYPSWKIEDTSGISHSGDCQVFTTEYGKILYELKTYTTNVNNDEVIKFKRDMNETNSDYGIFISQTSGIVGKTMVEYEIIKGKILVYVSNTGLNGLGMEIGTEILISLINIGVDNKKYFLRDTDIDNQIQNINDKLYDLSECISNFSKLKSLIIDIKQSIINNFDILYKNAYDYEIQANYLLKDIMNNIHNINTNKIIEKTEIDKLDEFIELYDNKKKQILYKLKEQLIKNNNEISIEENCITLIKNDIILGRVYIKSKIEIHFNIINKENITFNGNYEKIKSNNIIVLNLIDKDEIWNIINDRL